MLISFYLIHLVQQYDVSTAFLKNVYKIQNNKKPFKAYLVI